MESGVSEQKINRRSVLEMVGVTLAGFGLGGILGTNRNKSSKSTDMSTNQPLVATPIIPLATSSPAITPTAEISKAGEKPSPLTDPALPKPVLQTKPAEPTKVSEPQKTSSLINQGSNSIEVINQARLETEKRLSDRPEITRLFPNSNVSEKEIAIKMVDQEISDYKSQSDFEQSVNRTKRYDVMISDIAKSLGFMPDSVVSDFLPALIFVESRGNPNATPSKENLPENISDAEIAKGLCQIKLKTALPIAQSLGLPLDLNLFDTETNIKIGLENLKRLFLIFPEPSLAFWAHHLGDGHLMKAIKQYVIADKGVNQEVVEAILDDVNKGCAYLIKEYRLNFINLITSDNVINELKNINAWHDQTNLFVPRVAAAYSLLSKKS